MEEGNTGHGYGGHVPANEVLTQIGILLDQF
jgi:hypothetical protein